MNKGIKRARVRRLKLEKFNTKRKLHKREGSKSQGKVIRGWGTLHHSCGAHPAQPRTFPVPHWSNCHWAPHNPNYERGHRGGWGCWGQKSSRHCCRSYHHCSWARQDVEAPQWPAGNPTTKTLIFECFCAIRRWILSSSLQFVRNSLSWGTRQEDRGAMVLRLAQTWRIP